MTYRPDIDGLRAVAVLSVVLGHLGLGMPGGYVGVDVFFVISGYLIASLMLNDMQAGTFSLVRFWERRVRRILPALLVVVGVSFVAGWFLLVPKSYELFGRSAVSLALLKSNYFFARHTDYFAASAHEKPLLHTWSLAVEEQFYLVVPLLFWAAFRLRRQAWLGPLVAIAAAASFAYGVHGTAQFSRQAYYLLSTRAWELLSGVLAAIYLRKTVQVPHLWLELGGLAGISGIVIPFFVYGPATPFPGFAALPPVAGAVLLIATGTAAVRPTVVYRLLASRAAVGVGLISYSLYLWHWPLLVFARQHGGWHALLDTAWGSGLLAIAAAALAYVTNRYVEQPFRKAKFLATRPRLIAATAAAVVLLLIGGQALRSTNGAIARLPPQARLFARTGNLSGQFQHGGQTADGPLDLLRVGTAGLKPTLFVWGDSHALMVLPAIDDICQSAGMAGQCAVRPSCPPLVRHCTQTSPRELAEANAFGTAVARHVEDNNFDAVLLAGLWSGYFTHPDFAAALLETIDKLRSAGRRVYFLKDVPCYQFDVAAALVLRAWDGDDLQPLAFPRQAYASQNRQLETFLPQLVERGVIILDPIPHLQRDPSAADIPPFDAGGSFYADENHLSDYGARTIRPAFAALIDATETASPLNANHTRR
ncbi:MAG: acyltransferase family protein [Pirellulales bacterium]